MPWKECSAMDERIRFVARLLDGNNMAEVCREFGIWYCQVKSLIWTKIGR